MLYVVNDLHGAEELIKGTVSSINHLSEGDTLVINGDGAGARGPIMNNLVKVFYEVRRGETDVSALLAAVEKIIGEEPEIPRAWIYDTVHAGLFRKLLSDRYDAFRKCLKEELLAVLEETLTPLSEAAKKQGVKIIYLPGNGEITPEDFLTGNYTVEIAVVPGRRFYHLLAVNGFFGRFGIEYVPYATRLGDTLLLSTDLLDLDEVAINKLENLNLLGHDYTKVLVHYPPAIAPIGGAFSFWTPNNTDIRRTDVLRMILDTLKLKDAQIFFGHIHLGTNDPRMDLYPSTMGFEAAGYQCTWVKPGTVLKI